MSDIAGKTSLGDVKLTCILSTLSLLIGLEKIMKLINFRNSTDRCGVDIDAGIWLEINQYIKKVDDAWGIKIPDTDGMTVEAAFYTLNTHIIQYIQSYGLD